MVLLLRELVVLTGRGQGALAMVELRTMEVDLHSSRERDLHLTAEVEWLEDPLNLVL